MIKFVFALIAAVPFLSKANYKEYYFQEYQRLKVEASLTDQEKTISQKASAHWFEQKLDHTSPQDKRTFTQRYYVNRTNALNSNSPVFFYICGESTCHNSNVLRGAVIEYAQKYKGAIVALEHRYYGKSQPFAKLTTNNLAYLSTNQAIADLANFQRNISQTMGLNGPWIAIGGSYPGNLAAYYRLKHPELVVAALASSAPVKAEAEFDEYDAHVTKVVGPRCADHMREAVKEIENSLGSPEKLGKIKKEFKAQKIQNNIDFLYVVADIGAIAAQYGYVDQLCDSLRNASSALEGYADFARYIYLLWNLSPEQISIGSASSVDPEDYLEGFGMRQWLYQSCSEYGFWQTAHKTASTRSSLIDLEYHNNICNRLFGLTKEVSTEHINQTYYRDLLDPDKASNILFTNGSTDPWMNLSVLPGQTRNSEVEMFLIEGAAHCDDLSSSRASDSAGLNRARDLFMEILDRTL